ncbi:MAG: hypothetical protein IJW79_12010 [Clostridia bacterium]|nr:hypothetical protein [Clostridia bacterium]
MFRKEMMSIQEERVKEYLERYRIYKQMLDADNYAKDYSDADVPLCDGIILQAKMNEIERFVRSLPVCREQTLLFNHYIRGHSVDFCGEMMYVSRRTAYRIAKKAISLASEYYAE